MSVVFYFSVFRYDMIVVWLFGFLRFVKVIDVLGIWVVGFVRKVLSVFVFYFF